MVGALGETMPYFPPCVALEDQACGSQTPEMLTGCTKFDLQFLRDLAEAELRMCCEQFEDFNTPVIRETTDDFLEPLRPRPGTTDDTLGRLHQTRRLLPPAIPRQQHSNIPRNVGMFYPTPHPYFSPQVPRQKSDRRGCHSTQRTPRRIVCRAPPKGTSDRCGGEQLARGG